MLTIKEEMFEGKSVLQLKTNQEKIKATRGHEGGRRCGSVAVTTGRSGFLETRLKAALRGVAVAVRGQGEEEEAELSWRTC